jgi:hypothetical protein
MVEPGIKKPLCFFPSSDAASHKQPRNQSRNLRFARDLRYQLFFDGFDNPAHEKASKLLSF